MLISKSKYLIAFSCSYLKSTLNFDKKYPQNKNFLKKYFFMYIPPLGGGGGHSTQKSIFYKN